MNQNKNIEQIFEGARNESLTPTEREMLRARLQSFMRAHPMPAQKKPVLSPYSVMMLVRSRVAISLLASVLILFGTSSAIAEHALPGDLLYNLKTGLNEKVLGWFATSGQAQAEWQLSLADRRLTETETLAQEGKLSPMVLDHLQAEFTQNTDQALGIGAHPAPATLTPTSANVVSQSAIVANATSTEVSGNAGGSANGQGAVNQSNTASLTLAQITALRGQVQSFKTGLDEHKNTFHNANDFIRSKGNALITEKLLFDSTQALESGDNTKAMSLFGQAQTNVTNFSSTTAATDTIPKEEGSSVSAPGKQKIEDRHNSQPIPTVPSL